MIEEDDAVLLKGGDTEHLNTPTLGFRYVQGQLHFL